MSSESGITEIPRVRVPLPADCGDLPPPTRHRRYRAPYDRQTHREPKKGTQPVDGGDVENEDTEITDITEVKKITRVMGITQVF